MYRKAVYSKAVCNKAVYRKAVYNKMVYVKVLYNYMARNHKNMQPYEEQEEQVLTRPYNALRHKT